MVMYWRGNDGVGSDGGKVMPSSNVCIIEKSDRRDSDGGGNDGEAVMVK